MREKMLSVLRDAHVAGAGLAELLSELLLRGLQLAHELHHLRLPPRVHRLQLLLRAQPEREGQPEAGKRRESSPKRLARSAIRARERGAP